ncbi:hypothetical protein F2P79_005796 [Pimephales promelas]|nr:hypothetical protein F2P79_005796 [Pimephales promelas]
MANSDEERPPLSGKGVNLASSTGTVGPAHVDHQRAPSSPAASSISGLTEKVLPGHQSRIEDQEADHNEPSY